MHNSERPGVLKQLWLLSPPLSRFHLISVQSILEVQMSDVGLKDWIRLFDVWCPCLAETSDEALQREP